LLTGLSTAAAKDIDTSALVSDPAFASLLLGLLPPQRLLGSSLVMAMDSCGSPFTKTLLQVCRLDGVCSFRQCVRQGVRAQLVSTLPWSRAADDTAAVAAAILHGPVTHMLACGEHSHARMVVQLASRLLDALVGESTPVRTLHTHDHAPLGVNTGRQDSDTLAATVASSSFALVAAVVTCYERHATGRHNYPVIEALQALLRQMLPSPRFALAVLALGAQRALPASPAAADRVMAGLVGVLDERPALSALINYASRDIARARRVRAEVAGRRLTVVAA
jgi:hypothetical protein